LLGGNTKKTEGTKSGRRKFVRQIEEGRNRLGPGESFGSLLKRKNKTLEMSQRDSGKW